mgnify:CR=1 FL=1
MPNKKMELAIGLNINTIKKTMLYFMPKYYADKYDDYEVFCISRYNSYRPKSERIVKEKSGVVENGRIPHRKTTP